VNKYLIDIVDLDNKYNNYDSSIASKTDASVADKLRGYHGARSFNSGGPRMEYHSGYNFKTGTGKQAVICIAEFCFFVD
jgi:hypothetical protein